MTSTTVAAQAQAQAVRQRQITHTESVALVRVLVRVAMFETCFHRGLFPDSYFTPVKMAGLDGLYVNVLRGVDDDSRALLSWEQGVVQALERGFLKQLLFGIALDKDCTHVVEEYVFSFDTPVPTLAVKVGAGTEVRQLSSAAAAGPAAAAAAPTAESVRYEVSRLLRMLVTVTRTLEKVPEDRYLFAKLAYTDDCPADFEPEFFQAATGDSAYFPTRPFKMKLGSVTTPHHVVSLAVKSTLDAGGGAGGAAEGEEAVRENERVPELQDAGMESEAEDAAPPPPPARRVNNNKPLATEARDKIYGEDEDEQGEGGTVDGRPAAARGAVPPPIAEEPELEQEEEEDEAAALEAVITRLRQYAQGRAHLSFTAAMSGPLTDSPVARIEAAFAALVDEGALAPVRRGGDAYVVVAAAAEAAANAAAAAAADLGRRIKLAAAADGGAAGAPVAVASGAVAVGGGAGEDDDVTMAEADGDEGKKQQQQHGSEAAPLANAPFFASQRSALGVAAGAAAKKASVVAKPIRQVRGGRVAKPPSAAAAVAAAAAEAAGKNSNNNNKGSKAGAAAAGKPPPAPPAAAAAGGGRPARNRRAPARPGM